MREVTVSEDIILKDIYERGTVFLNSDDPEIDQLWDLVRAQYVTNLVSFSYDWSFKLTEEGINYVQGKQNE